jgi:hypothetical protein
VKTSFAGYTSRERHRRFFRSDAIARVETAGRRCEARRVYFAAYTGETDLPVFSVSGVLIQIGQLGKHHEAKTNYFISLLSSRGRCVLNEPPSRKRIPPVYGLSESSTDPYYLCLVERCATGTTSRTAFTQRCIWSFT